MISVLRKLFYVPTVNKVLIINNNNKSHESPKELKRKPYALSTVHIIYNPGHNILELQMF